MFRLMLAIFGYMFSMLLDTENGNDGPPKDDPPKDDPPGEAEYKFRQEDVDKYAGTARKEGKQAAERELSDSLGVSPDEAKKIIADHKEREEAQRSELDKANDRIKKLEEQGESTSKAANERIKKTELKLALRNADINPERLDMAVRLADLDKLTINDEGAVEGMEDSVKAVSDASPEWFAAPDGGKRQRRSPEFQQQKTQGLDAQISEAREKGDYRTVERLHAQKLSQQKAS